MKKDEYAIVLDYLPKGKTEMPPHKRVPIAQVVGTAFFSLLEVSPKDGVALESGEKVYIGDDDREKIDHIERRIKYEWLTPTAKSELPVSLESIVEDNEERFIQFYNTAGSISTRQHKLEIIPKIGKKHRDQILDEREIEPFVSFQDMRERLSGISPVKGITEKILKEIKGESKYYLFTPLVEKRQEIQKVKPNMEGEEDASRENTVFIGKKGVMSYVLAVVTQFNNGADHVKIKARGRAISRAVDAAEIVRQRFVEDAQIDGINISTESVEGEQGPVNVSAIEIILKK